MSPAWTDEIGVPTPAMQQLQREPERTRPLTEWERAKRHWATQERALLAFWCIRPKETNR